MSVGRSYNYPHVTALHWVLYRLARNHRALVTSHPWEWYLERAQETAMAMVRFAPDHSRFGQMEGTVFTLLLRDLQREGWSERARALEVAMKGRADLWCSLDYPYGSEMPWDSTGQEEVYYRERPDDLYLLRVGYGGLLGSVANVTREGFGPAAFHAYPSTLRIDGISGDFGPGLFGHAVNTATYLARHPELGWMAFGGNVVEEGDSVRLRPLDSGRSRVYLSPLGLWLTLDAGVFEEVALLGEAVRLTLGPATPWTPTARLRIERPAERQGGGEYQLEERFETARGSYLVPLRESATSVRLSPTDSRFGD